MIALPDLEAGNIAGACDSTLRPRCIAGGVLSRQLREPTEEDTVLFPSFPNKPSLVSASPAASFLLFLRPHLFINPYSSLYSSSLW